MAERRMRTMQSDQELKQAYEVFVDDEGILSLVTLGAVEESEASTRQAELIREDVMRILDQDPHKEYDMIVNLSPVGTMGGSVLARTMAGFFLRAAGKGENMRWFADREDAVKWLKEGG